MLVRLAYVRGRERVTEWKYEVSQGMRASSSTIPGFGFCGVLYRVGARTHGVWETGGP